MRIRLDIAYDGTDFHGWATQKDPHLRTVQGVVEDALSRILRTPIMLTVAGRTDAGVHASGQVAHFDVDPAAFNQRSIDGQPERLVRRLARFLPADIRISTVTEVPETFDARFAALRRYYSYRVTTADAGPLPTRVRDTAHWRKPVDIQAMQQAANLLVGLHDFAAFCKARPNATTVRDLQLFQWDDISTEQEPELYEATVVADAFCWSMVRSLVGASLIVGEGKQEPDLMRHLLGLGKRASIIPVAPARGLTLTKVDYPDPADYAARAAVARDRRVLPDHGAGGLD